MTSVASRMAMGAAMQQCRIVILPVQKPGSCCGLEEAGGMARAAELFMRWFRATQYFSERIADCFLLTRWLVVLD